MKRFLALLLALLLVIPVFASCKNVGRLTIIEDGTCNIVYDSDTVSNVALSTLCDAIEEETGVAPDPSRSGDVSKGTILVGNVSIDDYRSPIASLRYQDYFVGIDGDCYLIGGITEETTEEAIKYFIENVLPEIKDGAKLTVRAKDNALVEAEYRMEGLTIGGAAMSDFSIITPKSPTVNEFRTAVLLRQQITNMTGYLPAILTDEEDCPTEGKILIGTTLCGDTLPSEHAYAITVSGKTVKVAAATMLGHEAAQKALQNQMFNPRNETLQINDSFSLSGDGAENASAPLETDGDLRVMFSNIHGYPTTDDGPTPVKEASQQLAELYLTYLPDVLGTQEFSPNSYNAKLDQMIASEYTAVAVSTGGNYKTYTALFYRKSTMELLKSGYFGFDTLTYGEYPELMGSFSKETLKSASKDQSKGVTWGIFRVKATGKLVLVGSTHLWWKGGDVNEAARRIQIKALREHLSEQAAAFATENGINAAIPILVGGDYNTSLNRNGTALSVMETAGNSYSNANTLAKVKLTTTTHHGYATFDEVLGIYTDPKYGTTNAASAIDHIYVSNAGAAALTVNRVGILSDLYAHLSSDHNPIYTDISFTAASPTLTP
ncbi:MAG: hypothetical protein E7590_00640 [Ruminococcaceae bacterium]|nr:hypothetical protein [Oscillospiraceae bacterium]